MSTEFKFFDKEAEKFVDQAFARLEDAGQFLADAMRRNIGTQGPPRSTPGDYPHQDSGTLLNSIAVKSDKKTLSVVIEVNAPYAKDVDAKRPFIERTYNENFAAIQDIALGK